MKWQHHLIVSSGVGVVIGYIYSIFIPHLIGVPERYYLSYQEWTFLIGFSTVAYFFILSVYFLKKQEKELKRQYILAVIFALIAIFGFPALVILYEKLEGICLSDLEFLAMGCVMILSLLPIAITSTYVSFKL